MTTRDPILASDLDAYVDNQLTADRRIEVEAHLSAHPDSAARVMADLSLRGQLRLALATQTVTGRAETREAARRLERRLSSGRAVAMLQRIAAVTVLVASGWVAHTYVSPFGATEVNASVPPPAFVEQAVRAHQTALLREKMPSQPQVVDYNAEEIRAATAIVMPVLPAGWTVADVQVFPSDYGPSVEMEITAGSGQKLSLFAVRPGSFAVKKVKTFERDAAEAAHWQIGDVAYALVADHPSTVALRGAAETLARTLY